MKKAVSSLLLLFVIVCSMTLVACSSDGNNTCKHDDPSQIVVVEEVAPTCQETGLTEGMKCGLCGTMVVPQVTVETIKCIQSDWIIDVEASVADDGTVSGERHTECIMCEKTINSETNVIDGSLGLELALNDDGKSYSLVGIGTCNDTNIIIPSKYNWLPVTEIKYSAFEDCSSLTSVTIPDSVTSIGEQAFDSCTSLTSISLPNSVKYIGANAFASCPSLKNVYYKGDVVDWLEIEFAPSYWSGRNYYDSNPISYATNLYFYDELVTSITIPDSVTNINAGAFYYYRTLTSIIIGESVRTIGEKVFYKCDSLTIYCEAEVKPSGWDKNWNYLRWSSDGYLGEDIYCPVVWGYIEN